jgi:hypothetical protein
MIVLYMIICVFVISISVFLSEYYYDTGRFVMLYISLWCIGLGALFFIISGVLFLERVL